MPHAANDADDLPPDCSGVGFLDALPNRISAWPILLGHRLIDNRHHWRMLAIRARKLAPFEQRNAHHPEIVRGDRTEVGDWHTRPNFLLAVHVNAKTTV